MKKDIINHDDYFSKIKCPRKALEMALDIRKFEIELYWKRATYFWTLMAAVFTGYFALKNIDGNTDVFLISCLGVILSAAWFSVNRGSKYWQENWERHVDVLEDEEVGPLYRMTISRDQFRWWKLWDGYPYSVSKINNLVSLFVLFIWVGLAVHSSPMWPFLLTQFEFLTRIKIGKWLIAILTIFFFTLIIVQACFQKQKKPRRIHFVESNLENAQFGIGAKDD
jgi:hypothetical protein